MSNSITSLQNALSAYDNKSKQTQSRDYTLQLINQNEVYETQDDDTELRDAMKMAKIENQLKKTRKDNILRERALELRIERLSLQQAANRNSEKELQILRAEADALIKKNNVEASIDELQKLISDVQGTNNIPKTSDE